jgi:hypothetical protein
LPHGSAESNERARGSHVVSSQFVCRSVARQGDAVMWASRWRTSREYALHKFDATDCLRTGRSDSHICRHGTRERRRVEASVNKLAFTEYGYSVPKRRVPSRLTAGNLHVRIRGGLGAAMPRGYPTTDDHHREGPPRIFYASRAIRVIEAPRASRLPRQKAKRVDAAGGSHGPLASESDPDEMTMDAGSGDVQASRSRAS